MVGKFSTSISSTASASSSMSTQRNSARGKRSARARKPGRYATQVSHHAAQRQATRNSRLDSTRDRFYSRPDRNGRAARARLGRERESPRHSVAGGGGRPGAALPAGGDLSESTLGEGRVHEAERRPAGAR